ncbi:MAG: hypothetical protein K0U41_06405 [Gammaproteobacteria bacterium]|nr:hypothetical protein [Gammaproteobacteria bacterium]
MNTKALLVIADETGYAFYEDDPHSLVTSDEPFAWGSGGDYALGAMLHGATAEEACNIACDISQSCGLGVTVANLNNPDKFEGQDITPYKGKSFLQRLLCR